MRLRTYTRDDISDITTIHAWCNRTDVIARYLYPRIDQYPTSYRLGNWQFIRSATLAPSSITVVVETEPSDYPPSEQHKTPEVIGYAVYKRQGTSEQALEWQIPNCQWWAKLERGLLGLEDRYYRTFPAVQRAKELARFVEVLPALNTPFDSEIFKESIELALCFVRPDWQKRGVGKKLMHWGFEKGQREKVPVVVKSSPLGGAAYRACGFRSIKTVRMNKWFDEVEFGGEYPQLWVWEPILSAGDGIEGRWYERALEKERQIEKKMIQEEG